MSKQAKDFWDRPLSSRKVKRVLIRMGVNPITFKRGYESDHQKGTRKLRRPANREIVATEKFFIDGNYRALMDALDTTSRPKLDAILRRVMVWKSTGKR